MANELIFLEIPLLHILYYQVVNAALAVLMETVPPILSCLKDTL